MAVTYNWNYKPGVANKYGIIINASADDVRPANASYVALWGNDIGGNGSRLKPYRSIKRSHNLHPGAIIILGNGVYRLRLSLDFFSAPSVVGDGNVILDLTFFGPDSYSDKAYYNIKFKGDNNVKGTGSVNSLVDCFFEGISWNENNLPNGARIQTFARNVVICNTSAAVSISTSNAPIYDNITFHNCSYLDIQNNLGITIRNTIFSYCNIYISLSNPTKFNNCLFHNCNFKIGGTIPTKSELVYPSTPAGYTHISNLEDFQTAYQAVYPTLVTPFGNCRFADPKFNNVAINDFTLAFDSPAKNLSYFGTFIGAYSIAKSLAVKSDDSLSAFDNSTAQNLTVADNSLTLIDSTEIASIITKPIDNTLGREIAKLPVFGFNADRNGEYVDSTADLATSTVSAGTGLSASTPYSVEVGDITYNSQVYQPGDRFTTLTSSPGTFATTTDGVVREILEAPARENLQARFSGGSETTIDNTGVLIAGNWYYVEQDEVSYNGDTYAVGTFLKCVTGVTSFTGDGVVREVFADADPFFYFEINQKPTSNNVGNSRTGDILRGNGDKDFDRTAANVFPISRKFIQIKYTIQVNNLTP